MRSRIVKKQISGPKGRITVQGDVRAKARTYQPVPNQPYQPARTQAYPYLLAHPANPSYQLRSWPSPAVERPNLPFACEKKNTAADNGDYAKNRR
jgi:hypothetical protein